MTAGIDPRSWAFWAGACLVALFVADHPLIDLLVVSAAVAVAAALGRKPSPLRMLLLLGIGLVVFRTITFALTGHTGDTVLLALPSLDLPALLGGASLGGDVTAEVVLTSLVEGLRLVAVVCVFGAFFSVTETSQLIKFVPGFLFEAGLVVGIAVNFVPTLARTAGQIRDAQTMRGAGRKVAPYVVPMLATSLDRSVTLAESMESRGFARADARSDLYAYRITATLALMVAFGAGALTLMGGGSVLIGFGALFALLVVMWSLAGLSQAVKRTRYRRFRWTPADSVIVAGSMVAMLAAVAFSGGPSYNPYQSLGLEPPHLILVVACLSLMVPLVGGWRVRR